MPNPTDTAKMVTQTRTAPEFNQPHTDKTQVRSTVMRLANDGDNGDDYCENAIDNIICHGARAKEKVEVAGQNCLQIANQ